MATTQNTRNFTKKVLTKEQAIKALEFAKKNASQVKEAEKYTEYTVWQNKRPMYRIFNYKSGTVYFHDFIKEVNYSYIPA